VYNLCLINVITSFTEIAARTLFKNHKFKHIFLKNKLCK